LGCVQQHVTEQVRAGVGLTPPEKLQSVHLSPYFVVLAYDFGATFQVGKAAEAQSTLYWTQVVSHL
jgi:hypothetical protein